MNFIAWLLGLSVLIALLAQSMDFHRTTVCRQEAWLKSTQLATRALLPDASPREFEWHPNCRLQLLRSQKVITWQRFPNPKSHRFILDLKGKL